MKVFMFISGRSYGNNLKYKAFYVCMSFILMALFSTILTTKPAFAVDNPGSNPDSNPHYINKGSVKCPKNYLPKPENDKSMWWGCSGKTIWGERGEFTGDVDPVFTCNTGWKADFKIKTENQFQGSGLGRSVKRVSFKLGQCVEDKESVVEKNAEALANKAGQDKLVTLISPKIEASPWYLGLSDANKVAAGCKYQLLPGAPSRASEKGWFCDDAAKKKLARMLIGTCLANAVKDVAKRTNGDTGSSAMDAVFTSCLVKNSGVDAASINKEKGEIAWDDIKKDVDISEKKDEDGEPESSCSGDLGSLGWLICPSMSLGGKLADAGYSSVSMFLDISPDIFNDNPELGEAKQAWNFFRDIANVVFVLLFLWVIFSQISNVGVSNYGIKKILPKLILGAILINLSFYICQLAVDLSNILGYALKGVLEGASLRAETSDTGLGGGFVAVLTGALGLVGAPLFAFLTVSVPMLIWTLLSIGVALLILVFRQAAVILLIAISPIAFAAWLLPNTESLFKKWVSAFKGLLVVFPVVSLMYGSGKLAGAVLSNSSGGIMQFVAMCAPIVPLIATPFVIKSSLNSLGSIGAKISNNGLMNFPSNKLKDNVMNKSRFADAKKSFGRYSAKKLAESRSGNSKLQNLKNSNNKFAKTFGKVMSLGTRFDDTPFGRKLGLSDAAINYQEAYDKNAMEKAERALTYKYGGDAAKALNDKNADKYIRIAAVNQLKGQGTYGADKIAEYLNAGGKVDSVSMAKSLTDMKGSHAGVAKAGSEALQELQKEGGLSEINFSSDQFKNFTASGVSELSNKDIAGQSAKAIEKSNITADKATEILSDDILYSSANNAVISALKGKGGKRIIPQTPQDNQNNQGNNSQQSSQNNQQSNSNSGGE
jgi:hypothetical protein cdiviTM7_00597